MLKQQFWHSQGAVQQLITNLGRVPSTILEKCSQSRGPVATFIEPTEHIAHLSAALHSPRDGAVQPLLVLALPTAMAPPIETAPGHGATVAMDGAFTRLQPQHLRDTVSRSDIKHEARGFAFACRAPSFTSFPISLLRVISRPF
jgi:hypothetical protein